MKLISKHLAWAMAALLMACSGGAPAGGGAAGVDGSAGGDGAGGGAGGNAVAVGGPVGGGGGINPVSGAGASGAAGTVSLPAPGSMAIEPVEELLVMSIECTNVRGPTVECRGLEGSAPAGASLRLSVHPPNNLGTLNIGTALMVTVQPDGSWNSGPSHVIASAGQMIQVCLMKAGLCDESLFLTVPPEGGTVNGAQGIKKNMVVDSNGNIFYTQVVPRVWPKRAWSWRSLFFSEAYAIEPAPPLGDRRIVLTPEATRGLLGDRPFNLDLNPASVTQLAADCPPQPAELTPMVEDTGSRLQGNRATIWMQNKFNIGFYPEKIAWIPNANREQIRDLAAMSWGRVGGGLDNYLAAAVANFVYLVRYTDGASYLETRVEFPKDFEVSQLINSGAYLYVLLTPKAGGPKPAYAVYRIYKAFDYTAHSYSGPLTAMCAPPSPALSSLKSIEQIDAWNGWIAGVGFTDTGKYRLFVGSPEIMDDLIDFPPVTLKEYDHPVEVRILKRDYSGIGLAVLDPIEKKLTTISYKWATAPETAEFRETPLTGLNLNYPRTLSVDFDNAKLAFLDIAESGTRVYEYTFAGSGHDFRVSRAVPAVFFIGPQAPNTLRSVAGVWNYNDAMGSMREVETTPVYLEIDLNSEELQRGVRIPPGGAGGARVLPLR